MTNEDPAAPAPENATYKTVANEWWTSDDLAAHLGLKNIGDANRWFRRHLQAGHFDAYAEPCRPLFRRRDGAGPTGNSWLYWAPACVTVRASTTRGSSRLRDPS